MKENPLSKHDPNIKVSGILTGRMSHKEPNPAAKPCCGKDTNKDGNCPIHPEQRFKINDLVIVKPSAGNVGVESRLGVIKRMYGGGSMCSLEGIGGEVFAVSVRHLEPTPSKITKEQARVVIEAAEGFVWIRFLKRTDGSIRDMTCMYGVKKHLAGGPPAYDPKDHGLIVVWEPGEKGGYKAIPLDGLIQVHAMGKEYEVT